MLPKQSTPASPARSSEILQGQCAAHMQARDCRIPSASSSSRHPVLEYVLSQARRKVLPNAVLGLDVANQRVEPDAFHLRDQLELVPEEIFQAHAGLVTA